jgi:hypothetical protein
MKIKYKIRITVDELKLMTNSELHSDEPQKKWMHIKRTDNRTHTLKNLDR